MIQFSVMAPYKHPELGKRVFTKFVRVGEDIYVGETEYIGHKKIVAQDGLTSRIESLVKINPTQIDAGFLSIRGHELGLSENSESLDLPVEEFCDEARQISREVFAQQSPEHTVLGLERR